MNTTRRTEISLTETIVAVRYCGRWEIYELVDGIEMFSHYATAGESNQLESLI